MRSATDNAKKLESTEDYQVISGATREMLILSGLTLLALITRSFQLSTGNFSGDEIYTVNFAGDRYSTLVNPAYYVLALASFDLFGVSEFAARLPAMLLGVIATPVFYATWRTLIGRNAALIGALLIIFSSWHLFYSQFSRFYTGVFLFGSLSYYYFYQGLLRDDLVRVGGALIAAAFGFFFHVTLVMVPAACGAFALLVVLRPRAAQGAGLSKRVATTYLALCLLVALVALPLVWNLWQGRQSIGATWGGGPADLTLKVVRDVQLPIAFAAFFGLAVVLRKNAWLGMYFLVGIAIPLAFVLTAAAFLNSRSVYLFYSLPLIIALAGVLCEEVRCQLAADNRVASYSLTVILLAMMVPEFVSHYTGRQSLDVRKAVNYIETHRHSGDVVLSFSDTFDYYARKKYPVVDGLGHSRVRGHDRGEGMDDAIGDHERAWVMVSRGRKPLARDLEDWLSAHGRLVWRLPERRFDYTFRSYEIYLVERQPALRSEHTSG